ncbi:tRNA (N6-isopentenyl adenosine(37)-C2)-methylthiotransferase MiaB [Helicobacter zhangjianzhongii]|uniref:tRNA (N6-isopentenyl adenosine(37)-C2)-methylthiotransferase MiaB n=1 Tax=Helicobacter zhangjianzhongii TaxID=2974574 RepID=A0ACC6FQG6_9HELI|nr:MULTISPECIES: tRNA (N6-isopentenyl adenosine(37)-C2)-methylthiotransferase MiaB [unclassified Helicobacter]MDL0079334.1 tRNA (N6-isopentenyl adenosine(37)-C2)-methylthiotransferase MiaB [Helicobacter sp. CPD2-1]MDL0081365.1 tRNA (N6-isopentenyl adenosine(37)-C2)-methylthiotransferase MiaB [Helicobacter sp. XJK30-2]
MKLFVQTLGCAMNERDSEHMIAELERKEGYTLTDDATQADLILINTCSVREKPERRLFSEIGQYAQQKKKGAKIGVCGCTASHMGAEILKKSSAVDFVLGARNISKITQIIHKPKAVEVDLSYDDSLYAFEGVRSSGVKALLNISIGCDKSCAYCIVPHTRGKEISIPLDLILAEARKLAQNGIKELLLLGQNVNNYGVRFSSAHKPINFSGLLAELAEIKGIERIRFTSPHPLHMDDEFLQEFAHNPKVCKSIHMPLQSGSSRILKAMRRGYSKEWFLDRVQRLKELVPEVTISTDIIVGFVDESEEDFAHTLDVLEQVRFDTLYSFIYSPRPHTLAYSLNPAKHIPKDIAQARLSTLQERHREILREKAQAEIGKQYIVLVENTLQDEQGCFSEGRSDSNKLIHIENVALDLGTFARVKITRNEGGSLFGELV